MAYTKKGKIALMAGLILIPVIFVSLMVVNWFICPFSSATPNFADVEAVFSKLQIPADWQVIEETENSGIAGRQCPVESDGCFNSQKLYKLPSNTEKYDVQKVVLSSGCVSTSTQDKAQSGSTVQRQYYECMSGSVRVSGTWQNDSGNLTGRITTWSR